VYRAFTRKYGIVMHPEATDYVVDFMTRHALPEADMVQLLEQLALQYIQRTDNEGILDRAGMEELFRLLLNIETPAAPTDAPSVASNTMDMDTNSLAVASIDEHLHVIGAYELPRWHYSTEQGKYIRGLLRITNINSLRGRVGEEFLLFGMLSQLEEGRIYLEERDGSVALDLSSSIISPGLFTENTFVLARGQLTEDKVFKVHQLAMPPLETVTTLSPDSIDFLGLSLDHSSIEGLVQFEQSHKDASFIMNHLQTIFDGYASITDPTQLPTAFVLMGSFSSYHIHMSSSHHHPIDQYKSNFNQLADLISQHRMLRDHCRFIFVPGPNDPWSGDTLPQRPIPETFTEKLRARLRQVIFTSNPCRIRYGSQDIVVFRSNLLAKMRRYSVVSLEDRKHALSQQLVQTILAQGHLTPMPIHRQPIFWSVDHALRLYKTPDVLVLGDQASPFSTTQNGCLCFNPGSFPGNAHSWYVYWPASRTVEFR
ncbi:DNA polymerase alpha/epsilon subunit B-domain-containing protein, partial [Syncephalis plumigaleata]